MIMPHTLAGGNLTFNPLYKEVKNRITRSLIAGEWKPGEAIPSEPRLARHFNVSVGTIRKAIDELVAEKILVRQQGRGTFVTTHTEDRQLYYFFHIVGKDGGKEPPTHELLSFRKGKADSEENLRLGVSRGERVFRIHNVLKLAGKPVVLDAIVIPAARFPGLTEAVFSAREGTDLRLIPGALRHQRRAHQRAPVGSAPRCTDRGRARRDINTPMLMIKRVGSYLPRHAGRAAHELGQHRRSRVSERPLEKRNAQARRIDTWVSAARAESFCVCLLLIFDRRQHVIGAKCEALLDARGLARELAQIVELGAAHVAAALHFDRRDQR